VVFCMFVDVCASMCVREKEGCMCLHVHKNNYTHAPSSVRFNVLQCVCSMLQCVAVCGRMWQCVAVQPPGLGLFVLFPCEVL